MHDSSRSLAIIFATLLFAAFVGLFAYNAGVSHGVAQSGRIVAAPAAPTSPTAPAAPYAYPYPYPYYGWHPFGFGFGFFLFPLFFFIFWICIIRAIFWRGAWHRHHCWYDHERMNPEQK